MSSARKTILVVDDGALVRVYYRSILEGAGFQVAEALNGLEALEVLLTRTVDLLVVDINMPQMDGLTFLRVLRQRESPLAAVPALVTSTESAAADFAAARAAGANFYLVKPVEPERLVEFGRMLCGIRP
jgi:two-component system chemotaxis response regulator CheY